MSKILEILKQKDDKKIDSIQEQLAETYISPTKKKNLAGQKKIKSEKRIPKGWLSLFLVLAVLCTTSLALLFSANKLSISITVIKEAGPQQLNPVVAESDLPLHTIEFDGSANAQSKLADQYLYLVNSRGPGWANAKINFTEPINVVDNILSFSAKGERGGESLSVILKDTDSKTYQSINVAPNGLSKNWQNFSVELNKAGDWVDLASLSQMRLEFGKATVNNPVATTIYIKDLVLIKKGDGAK